MVSIIAGTVSPVAGQAEVTRNDKRLRRSVKLPRGMWRRGGGGIIWWRLRDPRNGERVPVTLQTADTGEARRRQAALEMLSDPRGKSLDLIERVCDHTMTVTELYAAHIARTTQKLREDADDADLSKHVADWHRWLTTRSRKPLAARQADDYRRQVRTLLPESRSFRRSRLTSKHVDRWLTELPAASTSTRARYYAALCSFVKYLRKVAGVISGNPLEEMERPSNAPPRAKYLPFADVQRVLPAITSDAARGVVALAFGSGMERTALQQLTAGDVIDKETRTLFARGTKNGYRSRYVIVDQWAWGYVEQHLDGKIGHAKLFEIDFGRVLDAFYAAQIAVGLALPLADGLSPAEARKTKGVSIKGHFHSLHDCRHSYAVNRMVGDDGEPTRDLQFIADQLGHADLQMASRIYAKHRNRIQQRAAAQHQAQLAAAVNAGAAAHETRPKLHNVQVQQQGRKSKT
jgi:integrase